MVTKTQEAKVDQPLTLSQRRAYMKLSLEERRKCLAEQVDKMVEHYEQASEQTEREAWQGGDIVDP